MVTFILMAPIWLLLRASQFCFAKMDWASGLFSVKINFETDLLDIRGRTAWTGLSTERQQDTP
jgi:hypothetical protein